ncbi:MAG: hypothetical protein ABIA63_03060 [bacterium]
MGDIFNKLSNVTMDTLMGHSDFLFARPSFIEGMARLFDFGNTLNIYNNSRTPEEADRWAMRKDFQAVGADIYSASEKVSNELNVK